jgi:hypothetical protein
MKKILGCLLLFAVAGTLFTGCGGNSMSNASPKEVLVAFFERISKKDIDGAAKLATSESAFIMELMKTQLKKAEGLENKMEMDPTEEFKNVEVGEAKINGDMATVSIRSKKYNREIDFPLKKEGGGWKVDFSMNTLMKMGENARNKAMEDGDRDDDTEPLKGMDSISLKKGLEAMDSVLKHADPKQLEEMKKALDKLKQPPQ